MQQPGSRGLLEAIQNERGKRQGQLQISSKSIEIPPSINGQAITGLALFSRAELRILVFDDGHQAVGMLRRCSLLIR